MVNGATGGSRFEMNQLPREVAKQVAELEPGQMSQPFVMTDKKNHTVVAMVRLTNRIDGHRADLRNDYQLIKRMYEASESERILAEWLEKKIRETYVRIEDGYRNCDFRYKGGSVSAKARLRRLPHPLMPTADCDGRRQMAPDISRPPGDTHGGLGHYGDRSGALHRHPDFATGTRRPNRPNDCADSARCRPRSERQGVFLSMPTLCASAKTISPTR